MTRCHRLENVSKGLVLTLLIMSPSVHAQFKTFKSKTRFKPQQVQPIKPSPSNNYQGGNPGEIMEDDNMPDDQLEELDASTPTSSNFGESSSNKNAFGARPTMRPKNAQTAKYVNLNPETAFGPEIVTSFDFPETDIMELTKHMQDLTGINLILDKDVKGKVSITAPTPITVGDAWKAYLAALNMAGFTLVKSGAFYKIINARDVRYVPTTIYTGSYTPDTEAHVMKILALKNVDASEISRNFRPFMSRYGRIIDIKQTNTIIISDTGANIARLEKLIKFLDVPGYEESLQILPVKNSSAQEIAKLLDEILKGNSSGSAGRASTRRGSAAPGGRFEGGGSSNNANISKIIAEPRTNSIIAMANSAGAKQLRDLINKLDVKLVSSSSGRIHVHYLNYGNAEELSKTLSSLVSGAQASSAGSAGGAAARRSFVSTQNNVGLFNGDVKVTADKNNNALVVTASPTDWLTLKSVIQKLDIPRDQVYVEGMIMETTITKARAFGVEYYGAYGKGAAQRGGFLSNNGLFDLVSGNPTGLSGFFVGGGGGGRVEIANPAGGDPIKVNSVNGLIRAISTNNASNVLATPQILALDNTEAEFEVGATVPIQNQVTNANGTTANNTTNQEAKLSLKITPQINKVTRFVKLKINQTINEFQAAIPGVNGRPTTTRSAVTEVMVRDKDTIAMGGLLRDRESISFNKVPLLGDIPVLGWLFKNKTKEVEKVNLLMFMTPRILSPYEKEANVHTRDRLSISKKELKETIIEGDKIPFHDNFKALEKKVELQNQGPLYEQGVNQYKESNTEAGIGNPNAQDSDMPEPEIPNYQEIMENLESENEE
jgi:general secretion pathway protein D